MTRAAVATAPEVRQTPRTGRAWGRWVLGAAVGITALAATLFVVLALNWPFQKQDVIDVLQERTARSVTIDRFYRTYFPPGCIAEGIRFLHRKHKEKAPLIEIKKMVMATSYGHILTLQHRLSLVRVFYMHVTVPPSIPGVPNPVMPLTYREAGPPLAIDRLIADGTVLDFLPQQQSKGTFRLLIDKLRVDGIADNKPMAYRTEISNTTPPGKIHSSGVFGTWNPKKPESTPLHGTYTYENANLTVFGIVSGTLSSSGKFEGTLGHLNAEGTTDIPNFKLTDTSHTRRLSARYQAAIDATKGDTVLNNVTATFDRTTVYFKGSVAGQPGMSGKVVSLDMQEASGRIEDLLDLFISSKEPPMTGNVTFRGHVDLPPGTGALVERMKVNGDFGVATGRFTNRETQDDLARLSESAEKKRGVVEENPETVVSDLEGHASSDRGVATLSRLSFTVPGAKAKLDGTYNLVNYKVDLRGVLITTGQPGDAATGFKSLIVKAMSPFFKRRHEAKIVPVKITGTYEKPDFTLDLGPKK
jgi:AsmA-like C-terminal region